MFIILKQNYFNVSVFNGSPWHYASLNEVKITFSASLYGFMKKMQLLFQFSLIFEVKSLFIRYD